MKKHTPVALGIALSPVVALLLTASLALAQHVVGARAGAIHFATGEVFVDGKPAQATPVNFPLLKNGQLLETGRGRAEVLMSEGVFLRLGERGALRMLANSLDDTRVLLQKGAALLEVVETSKNSHIQLQLGETRTTFKGMGVYRFESEPQELRVFGGQAEVFANDKKTAARRGKMVLLGPSLAVSKFDPDQAKDNLFEWAARRSFALFASSTEARRRRTHWEITITGWSWNRDFDMRLFSPVVAREFAAKQAQEQLEKANQERIQQQEEQRRQQEQIRQQQQPAPQQPQQPQPPPAKKP